MGNTTQSINPADNSLVAEYSNMEMPDINPVIEAAGKAQQEWSTWPLEKRAACFQKAASLLRDNKEEYAAIMAKEMGKPISQGIAEIEKCGWVCDYYAENAARFLADKPVATENSESFVCYQPIGLIFAIMPWNFPFWQVFRGAVPIMMGGNGVLLKHASNVFGCASAIEKIFTQAGFPENAFRSLLTGAKNAADIIAHPLIAGVTLTGSEPAGRSVAMEAGKNLKKCVLELGGSDPYVILEDADLDAAVASCAMSRMLNGGQVCIAAKRFIVVEAVYEAFEKKLLDYMQSYKMGDPLDKETNLGPMARTDLRDELHQQVMRSVDAGAKLLCGGEIPEQEGAWYPPTVLGGVIKGMPAFDEELFGPVSTLIPAKDEADAIAIANDSRFGLGSAVFTQDVEKGRALAREQINAGTCVVNDFVRSDPRLPFGGIKDSGFGRELGEHGILEFVNVKTVVVK